MGVKIIKQALNLLEAIAEVASPAFGAVVTFSGCVRSREKGGKIAAIDYEAYQAMALKELEKIVASAYELWGSKVSIHHRVGRVAVGEASVIIAASAAHRKEAFAACAYAIEQIKKHIPIWKKNFLLEEAL